MAETSLSVLQRFNRSALRMEPFPHCVIDNALPETVYEELSRSYPAVQTIFDLSFRKTEKSIAENTRYDLSAAEVCRMRDLPLGAWRDFVQYHVSQDFLDEVLDKLGETIATRYPALAAEMARKAPGGRPRAGVRRYSDKAARCELALDCQVGINSPTTATDTSVIGPHLDNPKELYAGLLYLRLPDDEAGGDLVIYEWRDKAAMSFTEKRYIDDARVVPRATVGYTANRFIWLLNGPDAVHGVTARGPTAQPRRLCNIIAEVYPTMPRLFDLCTLQPRRTIFQLIGKVPARIKRRFRVAAQGP